MENNMYYVMSKVGDNEEPPVAFIKRKVANDTFELAVASLINSKASVVAKNNWRVYMYTLNDDGKRNIHKMFYLPARV